MDIKPFLSLLAPFLCHSVSAETYAREKRSGRVFKAMLCYVEIASTIRCALDASIPVVEHVVLESQKPTRMRTAEEASIGSGRTFDILDQIEE